MEYHCNLGLLRGKEYHCDQHISTYQCYQCGGDKPHFPVPALNYVVLPKLEWYHLYPYPIYF